MRTLFFFSFAILAASFIGLCLDSPPAEAAGCQDAYSRCVAMCQGNAACMQNCNMGFAVCQQQAQQQQQQIQQRGPGPNQGQGQGQGSRQGQGPRGPRGPRP